MRANCENALSIDRHIFWKSLADMPGMGLPEDPTDQEPAPARPARASRPGDAPSHFRWRCPARCPAAVPGNPRASRRRTRGRVAAARTAATRLGLPSCRTALDRRSRTLRIHTKPLTHPRSQRIAQGRRTALSHFCVILPRHRAPAAPSHAIRKGKALRPTARNAHHL